VTLGLDWLPQTAFLFLLIFARVGTLLMLVPALGEQMIPARSRLGFALAFTLVLYPLIAPTLPVLPQGLDALGSLLLHELAVGLILGGILRLLLLATQVAGAVIAYQSGLSSAMLADPSQGGVQGAIIGTFLSLLSIALIFATDLHHLTLAAIYDSYMVFVPGNPLMIEDAVQMAVLSVGKAFVIGIQMSAPFIVFGLVFNLGLGLLSRLMPQLQVFFIAMPAQIGLGLALLALLLTMMMGWYLTHYEAELTMLRGR
jgi:flagellar biosynthetic protein FliR